MSKFLHVKVLHCTADTDRIMIISSQLATYIHCSLVHQFVNMHKNVHQHSGVHKHGLLKQILRVAVLQHQLILAYLNAVSMSY